MKKQKTAKTDLGIALNVLACYQSYCLRTGATHETLAKAMCSDDAQGVINEYLDVLKHERKCVLTSFTSDRINKIVDIIASVPDGKSVALGLVVLNAHLQKMYGSMCIMSQYDLSLMIDVVSDVESQSENIDNGTINYYCTQEENTKLKKKIILNSIRPICELKRMCQQDSILQAMYVWLIKGEGMSEEEFKNTVHGALYPGRAYFYKGWDNTTTDEEVERVAQACRGLFNNQTEICCGAIPGEPGTIWEPIKILGYGSSQAGTVD